MEEGNNEVVDVNNQEAQVSENVDNNNVVVNNVVVDNQNVNTNVNKPKKKMPVWGIVLIILGGIFALILIVFVILAVIGFNMMSEYMGTWKCNDQITVNITAREFNLSSDDNSLLVRSNYTLEDVGISDGYHKYLINASATKRVLNGKEYTGDYTTQFQIVVDEKNKDEMAMINTVSYSMYQCKRK